MDTKQHNVVALEVSGDEVRGLQDGFMGVRRLRICNRRDDGSRSQPYVCDFIVRPKGIDAVVVALWHRDGDGAVQVLLREGLRPAVSIGRPAARLPIPEPKERALWFTEVVAGIIEHDDMGEAGVRARAVAEIAEEAGYTVAPDALEFLGAGTFPSPGSMPEKYWLLSAEIARPSEQAQLSGDGSPMEEGARTRWAPLQGTIEACVDGAIEDAKTELILRRLRDALA